MLLGTAIVGPACAQYHGQGCGQERTIEEGRIISLDWVGGTIVIEWMQYYPVIKHDNITLSVPRDIAIKKDGATIGFTELNQFDTVALTYRRDAAIGLPEVTGMAVITHGY